MISVIVISKDELMLRHTLSDLRDSVATTATELVVVDASSGRLDAVRREFPSVRWIDYEPKSPGVTIPQQRNAGLRATARADIVVFTDAGCRLNPGWLERLTAPIADGTEEVTAGLTEGSGPWSVLYQRRDSPYPSYLNEAPTINLAISRTVLDKIGEFDESFEYGSDVDYSWRIVGLGSRIRFVPDTVVVSNWGSRRRQIRRSYQYGRARTRLYRKHRIPIRELVKRDPMFLAYPTFLVGLPIALVFPAYLLLLLIPVWRARNTRPLIVVLDHLVYGVGALTEALSEHWR